MSTYIEMYITTVNERRGNEVETDKKGSILEGLWWKDKGDNFILTSKI